MKSAALFGLLLVGCTTYDQIKPELDAAKVAWTDCIFRAVRQVDDGKSDPTSVAYGVGPRCAPQYLELTEQMLRPMTTENSQAFMRQQMRSDELKLITSAVLTYRRSLAAK